MQKNSDYFSMDDAKRLSQSPAAQRLMALLQEKSGDRTAQALSMAQNGNYEAARQLMASLLSDPEARALLQQLGGR